MTEFNYNYDPLFPLGEDTTQYRMLTKEFVRTKEFEGSDVLLVEPRGPPVPGPSPQAASGRDGRSGQFRQ
jgi:hypothetical protein